MPSSSAPTWSMPVDQFSPKDKDSFAYTTVIKRWPAILTNIISTMHTQVHELTMSNQSQNPREEGREHDNLEIKVKEGQEIIKGLSEIKYQLGRDKELSKIVDDGGPDPSSYNDYLEQNPGLSWHSAPWLFSECYLYRRIRTLFALNSHWTTFDPFFASKEETYKSSSTAIVHLAKSLLALEEQKESLLEGWEQEGSKLEVMYMEMMQAALWGNATDLSLLVNATYEDIQSLQSVGAAAQAESAKMILRNDLAGAWEHVKVLKKGRVDFVLDNAGFELYTDLILADFLITFTPFFEEAVFHPKLIPWFVSDTVPFDFQWAITVLSDPSFFTKHSTTITSEDLALLAKLSKRWQNHLDTGKFKLSVPMDLPLGKTHEKAEFWTEAWGYQDLPAKAPGLLVELKKADLTIFKGDLNYRKLVGDGKWEPDTPFETALGPLAGEINVLSLRTNKADPIVGLRPGLAEEIEKVAPDFRTSGKYAVISFCKAR